MYIIRKMEEKDITKIVDMEIKNLHDTLGYDMLLSEINNPFIRFIVLEISHEVVGYIGAYIVNNEAELLNFVIDTKYQRKGYGSILLKEISTDVNKIILEVDELNKQAINFYQKNNFRKIAIRKKYYKNLSDAIVMEKKI